MARLFGVNTKMRGSVGQWTYAQVNGQTIAKEKVIKKDVPTRTLAQMLRRMKWANIVAVWRSFEGKDKPSFENKDRTVSDFNEFMSANLAGYEIYLPKGIADQGGGVVAPYQVTRGSLPTVNVALGDNNVPISNIIVGGLTIGASTTLGAFSKAIVDNNSNTMWRDGDQLTVFILHQSIMNNVPRIITESVKIVLDTSDETTLLGDMIDVNLFAVTDGALGLSGPVSGGVAFIHSRRTVSGTRVSTQSFVVNNAAMEEYHTVDALDNAIQSYGGLNKEEYLTPDNDQTLSA